MTEIKNDIATTKKAGVFNMRIKQFVFVGLASFILSACESDKSTTLQDSLTGDNTVDTISTLDFGASVIPFPNNLLFLDALGATPADGTLQIPVEDATDLADPAVAMNALDGFSTVAPISTGFTGALDDASFPAGVKMYEVTLTSGAVTSVDRELTYGTEFVAALSSVDSTMSTLVILPLQPLKPKQAYMPVITNAVNSVSGRSVGPSGSYVLTHSLDPLHTGGVSNTPLLTDEQAQSLEPLRQATVVAEASLNTFDGTASSDIIISWNFTTQSISDVLVATRAQIVAADNVFSGFGSIVTTSPLGAANVHFGTLEVPYYLTASDDSTSPSNDPTALSSCWEGAGAGGAGNCAAGPHVTQFNPAPVAKSTETIPVIMTVPIITGGACGGVVPAAGWPVVIFQHGITRSRADLLAVADSIAQACMLGIAIDIPMHGITGNETDGSSAFKQMSVERTFDLDLITQDAEGNTTAAAPDGVIDSSGSHFVNLSNILNTRDNLRQAVSDLFVLVDAIVEGDVSVGPNTTDAAKIYYYGYSLGAIAGTVFTAMEPEVRDAVFVFGGASAVKILDGSFNRSPALVAGLGANGVVKGTADYEAFLGAAQTVVDAGDSVNFSTLLAAKGNGILFAELVGGNGSPSDLTVPNTVPDSNDTSGTVPAPLAGTEPQLALLGLTHVNASIVGAVDLQVVTKFTSGDHSSLLDPTADAAVTTELQTQAAGFLATDGQVLQVTDNTVLLAPQ